MTVKLPVIPSIRSFRDVESALNNFRSYLKEVGTILDQVTADETYSPIAQGVTGGDDHDHSGGDGAQISHINLSSKGTNTHAQIDTAVTASAGHIAAAAPHSGHEATAQKNAASGYAGLDASSRTTKGVDTTDDIIVDLATKGLVLKNDADGHYYRLTIVSGVASWADLGASKP